MLSGWRFRRRREGSGRSGGSSRRRLAWLRTQTTPRLSVQLAARHGTDSDVGSASGPPSIAASMYGFLRVQVTHWLTNQGAGLNLEDDILFSEGGRQTLHRIRRAWTKSTLGSPVYSSSDKADRNAQDVTRRIPLVSDRGAAQSHSIDGQTCR